MHLSSPSGVVPDRATLRRMRDALDSKGLQACLVGLESYYTVEEDGDGFFFTFESLEWCRNDLLMDLVMGAVLLSKTKARVYVVESVSSQQLILAVREHNDSSPAAKITKIGDAQHPNGFWRHDGSTSQQQRVPLQLTNPSQVAGLYMRIESNSGTPTQPGYETFRRKVLSDAQAWMASKGYNFGDGQIGIEFQSKGKSFLGIGLLSFPNISLEHAFFRLFWDFHWSSEGSTETYVMRLRSAV